MDRPDRVAREVVNLWLREHPDIAGAAYTARRSLEPAIAEAIRRAERREEAVHGPTR